MLALLFSTVMALGADGYQGVLDATTAQGQVDYAALHDAHALDPVVAALATASVPKERADQMAFWINAYNALTLDLVADHWPVASIRDLDGGKVWDTRTFTVAGRSLTLNQIENDILRPMGDPRVHAALNCASRGCPALAAKAFAGPTLDAELTAATRRWVRSAGGHQIDRTLRSVRFSSIFDWFGTDFAGTAGPDIPGVEGEAEAAARFVAPFLEPADRQFLLAGDYAVGWIDYDWAVNAR